MYEVFKVIEVPDDHDDVSDDAFITCQYFRPIKGGKHKLTDMTWTFKSNELGDVPKDAFTFTGSFASTTKNRLTLTFDAEAWHQKKAAGKAASVDETKRDDEIDALEGGDDIGDGEEPEDLFDPLSMEDVAKQLPDIKNVRSMLQFLVEDRRHLLSLSPKYHAELAGQGVEYDFGRTKWWFRTHNSHSTAGLKAKSKESFDGSVVTMAHTRKFARRARDYMRAYKRGHKGLEVEIFTKKYKTHRCALDTDYTFVTED